MKPFRILSLLAVVLVVNAQSSSGSASDPGASQSASDSAGGNSASNPASNSADPTSDSASSVPPTSTPPSSTPPPPTPPANSVSVSRSLSTDAQGDTVTIDVTSTLPPASSTGSPSPSTSAKPPSNSTLSTGGIVGLSVAGGVAVICLIAFLIWKFTRKSSGGFDDNEDIKWPELNAHGDGGGDIHPMPVTNTGRAGFETGSDLSRAPSHSTYNASSTDFHGSEDPYSVPPLPHLNPGQPYRDDPGAPGAYYDPYRGPVPQTFNEAGGEAIPMTQMGRASPAPMMYDAAGRASPAPMAYAGGRTPSPGPQMAYGGPRTASPGPQMAYGGPARMASPGPQAAYGSGRASPGPQAAYGGGL